MSDTHTNGLHVHTKEKENIPHYFVFQTLKEAFSNKLLSPDCEQSCLITACTPQTPP